jgi:transcriptional accessory protein Tex/SPT6
MDKIIKVLAQELNIGEKQVTATVGLLDEGNTVPFIARYRRRLPEGFLMNSSGICLNDCHILETLKPERLR